MRDPFVEAVVYGIPVDTLACAAIAMRKSAGWTKVPSMVGPRGFVLTSNQVKHRSDKVHGEIDGK